MPKTLFVDNVSTINAAWANLVYLHNHLGQDVDGSAPKITIEELEESLATLLGDLSGIRSLIPQLFFEDKIRAAVFGGLGGDGSYNGTFPLTNSQYEFTDFTIPVGTNIQVPNGSVRIKVQGNILIDGSLTGQPRNPYGLGKAWFTTGGEAYNTGADIKGSGGAETVDHTNASGLQVIRDRGGFGGCGITIEALGTIEINGTISCNGANAGTAQIISGSPTLGGSGGGSGGSCRIQSFTQIQYDGTLDLIGGNGANGYGTNAAGGGGGAGGVAELMAPVLNVAVNAINVNGGAPGTNTGSGANLSGAGGGFGGKGGNSKQAGAIGKIIQTIRGNFSFV